MRSEMSVQAGGTHGDKDQLLLALSDVFSLLAEVYLEPEADTVSRAATLVGICPETCRDMAGLPDALRGLIEHRGPAQQQAVEYVRLFIHGTSNATIHPYESVFTHGRLMDPECLSDLRRLHGEAGLHPRPEVHLPPDHLGLELEFLSYLVGQAASAPDGEAAHWKGLAEELLRHHLVPFVRRFAGKLLESRPSPYFASAGHALVEALHACVLLLDLPPTEFAGTV